MMLRKIRKFLFDLGIFCLWTPGFIIGFLYFMVSRGFLGAFIIVGPKYLAKFTGGKRRR